MTPHESDFDAFLARLRPLAGLASQTELARLLGVNRSAITQAKKRGMVPEAWIARLARSLAVDPEWLATGRGQASGMTTGQAPGRTAGSAARPGRVSATGAFPAVEVAPETVLVPKVEARLCAGAGSFEVGAEVRERVPFRFDWLARRGNPSAMVLMDVVGNSMEPELKNGDTVLVDCAQQRVFAYGIYAVGVEDTVMVKRIEKRPGQLALLSDNPDYAPIVLAGSEIDGVRIIGRVLWSGREFR